MLPLPSSTLGSAVVSCAETPGDHLTYLTPTNGRELSQAACTASSLTLRVPRDACSPNLTSGVPGGSQLSPSPTRRPALNSQPRPFLETLGEGRRPWEGLASAQDGGQGWDPLDRMDAWSQGSPHSGCASASRAWGRADGVTCQRKHDRLSGLVAVPR